jgi:hypothetical protein
VCIQTTSTPPSLRARIGRITTRVLRKRVEAVLQNLNAALVKERTRQWGAKEPEISNDPEAAHLQKAGLDLPKIMAERIVTQEPTVKDRRHR